MSKKTKIETQYPVHVCCGKIVSSSKLFYFYRFTNNSIFIFLFNLFVSMKFAYSFVYHPGCFDSLKILYFICFCMKSIFDSIRIVRVKWFVLLNFQINRLSKKNVFHLKCIAKWLISRFIFTFVCVCVCINKIRYLSIWILNFMYKKTVFFLLYR